DRIQSPAPGATRRAVSSMPRGMRAGPMAEMRGGPVEAPAGGGQASGPGGRRGHGAGTALSATALGLIGLWVAWWVASARRDHLVLGRLTWVPTLPVLAGDFRVHIDHAARLQAAGLDPYRQ